jgi:hypothetical protein
MTEADEAAIADLDHSAWSVSLHHDDSPQQEYALAELTGLNTRPGWSEGMRLLVRRTRPSRRHQRS